MSNKGKKRNKEAILKINKTCDKECDKDDFVCPKLLETDDDPTKVAGLGFRCAYTVVAWVMLGFNIPNGNGYFMSLILFAAPLFIDYLRFRPSDLKIRKHLRRAGIIVTLIWIFLGVFGLGGVLSVITIENISNINISENFVVLKGIHFSSKYLWMFLGISALLTIADYFAYSTKYERALVNSGAIAS